MLFRSPRFVFAILILMVSFQSIAGADEKNILELLPRDTLIYAEITSLEKLSEALDQSPFAKIWNAESMATFRNNLAENSQSVEQVILETYGIDFDLLQEYSVGEFVVSGFETSRGTLSLTFLIDVGDAELALALLDATADKIANTGAVKLTESIGENSLTFNLSKISSEDVTLSPLGSRLMVSGDVEIASMLRNRWDGANDAGLSENPDFIAAMKNIPEGEGASVQWYLNPISLAVVLTEDGNTNGGSVSSEGDVRPPFPMRHGLAGLKAITGKFWVPSVDWTYRASVAIYAPPPRTGALAIFDFPAAKFDSPTFVPNRASVVTQTSWNLVSIIQNLGDVYDDVTDSPGAFRDTLDEIKDELRVDIENEIFANIGPDVVSFSIHDASKDIEGSLVSVAIKNPDVNEKVVASALYGLLIEDTETLRRRLPGFKYELWQMGITTGDGATPFSKAGIMVARGKLWLSTHASMLAEMVSNPTKDPITESNDYAKLDTLNSVGSSNGEFSRTFARVDADFRYTYQIIRQGGIDGLREAENLYSQLILQVVDAIGYEEDVDFSTLPEFDLIRQYLGVTSITARSTDSGWEISLGGIPR